VENYSIVQTKKINPALTRPHDPSEEYHTPTTIKRKHIKKASKDTSEMTRQKLLVAMNQRDQPDSKNFLNAQIAFMESLKNKDRLESIFNKNGGKIVVKKKKSSKKVKQNTTKALSKLLSEEMKKESSREEELDDAIKNTDYSLELNEEDVDKIYTMINNHRSNTNLMSTV